MFNLFGRKKFTEEELDSIDKYVDELLDKSEDCIKKLSEAKTPAENDTFYLELKDLYNRLEMLSEKIFAGRRKLLGSMRDTIRTARFTANQIYVENAIRYIGLS